MKTELTFRQTIKEVVLHDTAGRGDKKTTY